MQLTMLCYIQVTMHLYTGNSMLYITDKLYSMLLAHSSDDTTITHLKQKHFIKYI